MKMAFHYFKFLLICFSTIFLLPSCSRYLATDGANKIKRKVFIRITSIVAGTSNLVMVDENGQPADTFQAFSGQKVIWEIEDKADIKSIEKIYSKNGYNNSPIYKKGPKKRFLSMKKKWKGNFIETKLQIGEHYNIDWKNKKTGETKTYDPLMQLNPIKSN
jgi:hypothetical protein